MCGIKPTISFAYEYKIPNRLGSKSNEYMLGVILSPVENSGVSRSSSCLTTRLISIGSRSHKRAIQSHDGDLNSAVLRRLVDRVSWFHVLNCILQTLLFQLVVEQIRFIQQSYW